jgi:hypothetical protein
MMKKMPTNFILDFEFDGDCSKLLEAVKNGHAIYIDGRPLPIPNAMMQGNQLLLPLYHRLVIFDLSIAMQYLKNMKTVRLTMNIEK